MQEPGASLRGVEVLRGAGLRSFRAHGLIDGSGGFESGALTSSDAFIVSLTGEPAAYLAERRTEYPKQFKNLRRFARKLEQEVGPFTLIGPDGSEPALEQLLAWKRAQYRRTGRHDVLGADWSNQLIRSLFEKREGELQGLLLTLRCGERIVAGKFGVRRGDVFHSWIAAYDPQLSSYAPGRICVQEVITAMPRLQLTRFDLGTGHRDYKGPFSSEVALTRVGDISACGGPGGLEQSPDGGWKTRAPSRPEILNRVKRRLDHIAAAEPSLGGRLRGVAVAIRAMGRAPAQAADS